MAGATTAERGGLRRTSDSGRRPPTRRRRWFGRPRLLAVLIVMAALLGGFGTWALYGSDWLRVERVSVRWHEGPRVLTADQVLEVADVPVGSPMASLDKGAIGDRLLAELPRLASVDVVRGWPHGVALKVTERSPAVLIATGGAFREVDGEGVVFGERAEALPGVPLLELELTESPSLRRFGEDRVRAEAVSVVDALPGSVREDLRVVRVASFDAITLELSGDRVVRWGSAEDSDAKATALAAVMNAADGARHFDVSAPSAPAASGG
ncbi:cell division protein FtsQ/DivIB [Streptomyces radicis]|uniref:FtsQ-type POTRA domain-containing protein n=1 Tax=Streptomyces radicis TaxID=1750517 RepID=A0A3A9W0Y7_9ACTN|nr:FtsQ-type POTRA domain-containing protein [Streptomyces radicis]RKN06103.1 FtsQ-type POTRA domain-containing protein [Streptomyces radicis]RKN18472.1 FtsQ-type POTRA domain-containing protein [Streptomyces radicis]